VLQPQEETGHIMNSWYVWSILRNNQGTRYERGGLSSKHGVEMNRERTEEWEKDRMGAYMHGKFLGNAFRCICLDY